ncbi:MAG: hypothetical protein IT331_25640 [Anaerolineae bacterium]|nr:hypothetical protein [Anaerolineae bacterium]
MKTKNQFIAVGFTIVMLGAILFVAINALAPSLDLSPLQALQSATATPASTAPQGDVIPIKPLTELKSLSATVNLGVNGLLDGKRTQGDLKAIVTTNDEDKSQISVSGSLLGPIAAQIGGSLVGLFTPKQADVFKVPQGTFVSIPGFLPICIKPNAPEATEALEELSPSELMTMLTNNDVARGKFVGNETLNGVAVKHYVINGDAFLQAAQKSSNDRVKTFGQALWSAEDADLYIDAQGGHAVAFRGSYSGEFEPLKFQGDFDVAIDLTSVNQNTPINLPSSCNNPITP